MLGLTKIDGKTQHYWSPDYGIILVKSSTWKGLRILSKEFDNELNSLLIVLMNDKAMMFFDDNQTEKVLDMGIDSLINKDLNFSNH